MEVVGGTTICRLGPEPGKHTGSLLHSSRPLLPGKKHFLYVASVAELSVHNGKLKFHFHVKLVNNGFQESLNKHAQDTVSILSLSTGRQPSGWKINQLYSYFGGVWDEMWGKAKCRSALYQSFCSSPELWCGQGWSLLWFRVIFVLACCTNRRCSCLDVQL